MPHHDQPVVLFIDDEQFMLNAYQRMFRQSTWHSLFCLTLKEASFALEHNPVQLILCDYYLTDGTGVEFFRSLGNQKHSAKRVLLSGSSEVLSEDLQQQGLIDTLMLKPCSKEQLSQVIQQSLATLMPVSLL